MLRILTAQKKTQLIRAVFYPALQGYKFKFEPLTDDLPNPSFGDVQVFCGGRGVALLQQHAIVPKGRTVNSLREKLWEHPKGGKIMVTYDPGITQIDPSKEVLCQWDVRLAARYDTTGSLEPKIGNYSWVPHFNASMAAVKAAYADSGGVPVPVALDLETIGLDPYRKPSEDHPGARIVSVSLTVEPGTAEVYYVPESGVEPHIKEQLQLIANSPKVKLVGANLKFDIGWLKHHWDVDITNQTFDTTLVGSLLNENISNSLNMHAKIHTEMGGYDDPFNATYNKARMDLVPKENLLTYAGGDTDACLQVHTKLRGKLLDDQALANFYVQLLHPASLVFAKLEQRGVVVNQERYKEVAAEVREVERDLHRKALMLLPRKIRIKYRDDLKLSRAVIKQEYLFSKKGLGLKPIMFTEKNNDPSTALEHMEELLYQNPNPELERFVELMREWGSAKKTMDTYVTGFRKHIRSDGKFHPSYMLHRGSYGDADTAGTVSGRLSAKDPAWQTVPKHTIWAHALRSVYDPPPGYVILKLDYSQGELRVTACVAEEPVMLGTYKQGIDLHLKTGAFINGYELDEALKLMQSEDDSAKKEIKTIRQGGKAGNFGLIYGMQAPGFQDYIRGTFNVHWELSKCVTVREQFFSTYPGLVEWHKRYKKIAGMHSMVRSPLGRIRHLPMANSPNSEKRNAALRQAINSPIQSTLSDMMLLAMVEIDRRYPDLWMFGMTHDEVQMYVPEDELDAWVPRIKEIMENLPLEKLGWNPQLSFPVDAEYSAVNLAECKEYGGAA